ncbi:MAG: hypothetical protein KIS81_07275 [Maricaulaceae bacterium]|nr:hypothetical protein [Maricaulaceae bacterium]
MSADAKQLAEIRDFALDVARSAGEVILPFFRTAAVELKPDGTEVTEADRRAEEHVRERLVAAFPHAAVLGEEFGGEARALPGDQWIVDPLDGTSAFALGYPMFGTLVALLRDGEPVVGVIHMPALGESVYAASGSGCWYAAQGAAPQRVRTDAVGDLSRAFVSSSGVHVSEVQPVDGFPPYRLAPLVAKARKFRVVGDCVQHAFVCRGRLHLAVDAIMAPWDSAALIPCVREAGGALSLMNGGDDLVFGGSLVSASDEAVLAAALAAMKGGD